jgi:bacteriocin-like protein
MSIIETRELTDAELNEISGGEVVGPGLFHSSVGGLSFDYNANTGTTTIWAGSFKNGVECGSNDGHCRPL